ncbi:class I SAM-dependent methyltransferase [Actinoplanes sp. TFC3]|uniref:class I SAM-dependent methyltransferase n=1 Tax=Actinoplanes sp. TFC3 TaxID=1710355 RepID=UPI00083756CD|nr:class I SAM-dependent methyltransferase [Actinoplanes sp. TFC3]
MTAPGFDPVKFKAGQRALWNSASEVWSDLPPEFAAGARLLDRELLRLSGLRRGQRVLDVACGTGDTALSAAQVVGDSGSVTGIDLASDMIAAARKRADDQPHVEFRVADADDVELAPGSYDVILSRWGLMFSADRPALFRRLRELLTDDGVLAAVTWGPDHRSPMMTLGGTVLAARLELPTPPPGAPGPSGMVDPEKIRTEFTGAGFSAVTVAEFMVPFSVSSPQRYAAFVRDMSPPMMQQMLQQRFGDAGDPATWQLVAAAAEPYVAADGTVQLPSSTNLIRAVR